MRAAIAIVTLLALAPGAAAKVRIQVTSNRADLVSGGDARIVVTGARKARITLGKRDVTQAFERRGRRREGVVTGLKLGRNVVRVERTRLVITNHAQSGPILAGPQIQPWQCQDTRVDAQCNQPPKFNYLYKSTDDRQKDLQPYDPESPPDDVATVTTENGQTVPFVVRMETGYQDRDQYKIAVLFDPRQGWSGMHPQPTFNHKLLITHGANCDVDYGAGSAPNVTSYDPSGLPVGSPGGAKTDSAEYALGRGFVVMSTALDNAGHNCDVARGAESLVMAKEHVIEAYGTLRYTIGTGCSGGSLSQQWIANAYPGIYQGILPTCSFPDAWTSTTQVVDYHLLREYFEDASKWGPGIVWSPTQFGPVEGNMLLADAVVSDVGYFSSIVPTHACDGLTDDQRYDPAARPAGVRCTIADLAINVFGPRVPVVWGANEQKVGHGFAGVAIDNVGVQYGLGSLRHSEITPAQFVDLNARIGGLDIDMQLTAARIRADQPALARAYRSGMINETTNLDRTPIIDCRGPDPGAAHDSYRTFAIRQRLDRAHGTHENQVVWEGPVAIVGDTECAQLSLIAMDRWLTAVRKDASAKPLAQKVIADRPGDVADACFNGHGEKVSDGLCPASVVPVYGTPRTVAGDALTTDTNKCALKPLVRTDYPVAFTDAQFAQLRDTFPDGVCDFSRPGIDQQPTIPWLRYGTAKHVVYGGRRLAPAPRSHRR